jgi:hypothetical protein
MFVVEPVETDRPSESAAGVEPDRIIGTIRRAGGTDRENVAVMLRTYQGCRFVDVREVPTRLVLLRTRQGVTYSLDTLSETIDMFRVDHERFCNRDGGMGYGCVRPLNGYRRCFLYIWTDDLPPLIALLRRAHDVAAELGWCAPGNLSRDRAARDFPRSTRAGREA